MKKIFIALCMVFTGMTVNAQLFMGARFDINATQVRADNGLKETTTSSIGAYADVGYRLTTVWDLGVEYGGRVGSTKNHTADTKATSAHWLLSPYVRYSVIQMGKFELLGKGSLALEGTKVDYSIGLHVVPVLAYNLNASFALQTSLNFAGFDVSYDKVKGGDANVGFHLGADTNRLATLGNLTIGFLYKF